VTPAEAKSRLAGDPTFDLWDEAKQAWFCGRVVEIQSAAERLKDPDYGPSLARLKSSLRKTIAELGPLGGVAIDYLAGGLPFPNVSHAIAELQAFEKTAKRLLAMPKPVLTELTTATDDDPWGGVSAGGDPGSRRKWRNGVATAMVHELIEDAGVAIARTGKSIYSEGSPSMKLMARVLDCLDPKKRPRKTDTVLKRVVRTKGKKTPKK
jgi:hypothetical protein